MKQERNVYKSLFILKRMWGEKNNIKGSIILTMSLIILILLIIFGIYYILSYQHHNPNKLINKKSYVSDLFVSGNYAYATMNSWNKNILKIFDISNPSSLREIGNYNLKKDGPESIFVSGNYAYLFEEYRVNSSGPISGGFRTLLEILDISNPSSPREIESKVYQGLFREISFRQKKFIYKIIYDPNFSSPSHLEILDVSDPTSPKEVGTYNSSKGSSIGEFFVLGNKLYLLYSNQRSSYLKILNISEPSSLKELISYKLKVQPEDIFVSNNYAYFLYSFFDKDSNRFYGIKIFNISNSSPLKEIGDIKTNIGFFKIISVSGKKSIYVSNGYVYILDESYGLRIINATNPTSPKEIVGEPFEINRSSKNFFNEKEFYLMNKTGSLKIIKLKN